MSTAVAPTAADYQACLTEPSQIAQTSRGPVEYAERGTGPPLLSLHGSPAAFEQVVLARGGSRWPRSCRVWLCR